MQKVQICKAPSALPPRRHAWNTEFLDIRNARVILIFSRNACAQAALPPPAYEPVATSPVRINDGMVQVRDDRFD